MSSSEKNKYNLRDKKKNKRMSRKRTIINSDDSSDEFDDDFDPKNKSKKLKREKDSESEESESEESESEDQGSIIIDFGKLFGLSEDKEIIEDPAKIKYLDSLTCEKRRLLLEKEEKLMKPISEEIPLRYKILNMDLEEKIVSQIFHKVVEFEKMNPMFGSSEYYKLKKYLDGFVKIPFGKYKKLAVCKEDSPETIKDFLSRLEFNLTSSIYGQNKAKNTILQIMGSWISNPVKTGNVIGLHGCPGTGKTSMAKAFAKSLDIPVVFIPLGGLSAGLTLNGSDYVFEGSSWGKIVSHLMETKCMNPIFFFDELDKISDTKEGNDVSNLLIHLTDPTQNNEFCDKYFSGINFDLSRCFFIFSFNDKNLINPILKDRINLVKMDDFSLNDKVVIAQRYSIEKIGENVGLNPALYKIPEETLKTIASNYCCLEKGVRKMEQCLKTLIMKINLFYLTGDYTSLQLDNKNRLDIKFPLVITPELANSLLASVYKDDISASIMMMYT